MCFGFGYTEKWRIKITFTSHFVSLFRVVNLWKLTVDVEKKSAFAIHSIYSESNQLLSSRTTDVGPGGYAEFPHRPSHLPEDSYRTRAIRQPRVALPFDQSLITFTCSCIILAYPFSWRASAQTPAYVRLLDGVCIQYVLNIYIYIRHFQVLIAMWYPMRACICARRVRVCLGKTRPTCHHDITREHQRSGGIKIVLDDQLLRHMKISKHHGGSRFAREIITTGYFHHCDYHHRDVKHDAYNELEFFFVQTILRLPVFNRVKSRRVIGASRSCSAVRPSILFIAINST